METLTLDGGFDLPVFAAQGTFRALMDAFANPGQPQPLAYTLHPPAGLAAELAAVALTMCDHDTSLWLDAPIAEAPGVAAWLRFHTSAPLATELRDAQFALAADAMHLPALEEFALGTDEYPDRSTTVALKLPSLSGGPVLTLRGPGISGSVAIAPVGLPPDFIAQWAGNRALFPRGIDLLLVADGKVIGLPRTTRISEG
ncbi:MAG: phosphonate C-P lyase system protein PhnH [Devosia sp.]